MENQGLQVDHNTVPSHQPTAENKEKILRCMESLVHASQCRDANCRKVRCARLKRVEQHHRGCTRRPRAACGACRQFMALCIHHAKACQERKCLVPFCLKIRYRLRKLHSEEQLISTSLPSPPLPTSMDTEVVANIEMPVVNEAIDVPTTVYETCTLCVTLPGEITSKEPVMSEPTRSPELSAISESYENYVRENPMH